MRKFASAPGREEQRDGERATKDRGKRERRARGGELEAAVSRGSQGGGILSTEAAAKVLRSRRASDPGRARILAALARVEGHPSGSLGPRRGGGRGARPCADASKLPPARCSAPPASRRSRCASPMPRSRAARRRRLRAEHVGAIWPPTRCPTTTPSSSRGRVRVGYPIAIDRVIGLGVRRRCGCSAVLASPARSTASSACSSGATGCGSSSRTQASLYVLLRRPERFGRSAARMYAVFDLGAVFYWAIPTAPPWWAALARRPRGRSDAVARCAG